MVEIIQQVSVSQINTFNACQGKHDLQYRQGIQSMGSGSNAVHIGSVFHMGMSAALRHCATHLQDGKTRSMLAVHTEMENAAADVIYAWADANRPSPVIQFDDLVVSNPDDTIEWEESMELAIKLVKRTLDYLAFWQNYRVAFDALNRPMVEYELSTTVHVNNSPSAVRVVGFVDCVLTNLSLGRLEVIDWKTTDRDFKTIDDVELDMQIPIYQTILYMQYGIDAPLGTMVQIKSRVPGEPKTLKPDKTGAIKLSRDKAQYTDWKTYLKTILALGLDPAEYMDMRYVLKTDDDFFQTHRIMRTEDNYRYFWSNFLTQVAHMRETKFWPFAHNAWVCRGCQFRQWCIARVQGYNPEDLIGTYYEKRQERA